MNEALLNKKSRITASSTGRRQWEQIRGMKPLFYWSLLWECCMEWKEEIEKSTNIYLLYVGWHQPNDCCIVYVTPISHYYECSSEKFAISSISYKTLLTHNRLTFSLFLLLNWNTTVEKVWITIVLFIHSHFLSLGIVVMMFG